MCVCVCVCVCVCAWQAMGVYLYGELMVQEDARQQALARHCLYIIKDGMDQSAHSVVEEMILWTQSNQVRVSRPFWPFI